MSKKKLDWDKLSDEQKEAVVDEAMAKDAERGKMFLASIPGTRRHHQAWNNLRLVRGRGLIFTGAERISVSDGEFHVIANAECPCGNAVLEVIAERNQPGPGYVSVTLPPLPMWNEKLRREVFNLRHMASLILGEEVAATYLGGEKHEVYQISFGGSDLAFPTPTDCLDFVRAEAALRARRPGVSDEGKAVT